MRKYIAIIAALAFVLSAHAKRRPLNEEKIINEIWARTDMPEFNDFSVDEKYKNEPMVIIARYDEFIGDYKVITLANSSPKRVKKLYRYLMKINDNSSIKAISEITYKNYSKSQKSVVGIRIHKQDGTLVELNPNDYIKVSTNLKKKNTQNDVSKIAVPNLQKGDIVDYFIYQEVVPELYEQFEFTLNDIAPIQKYRFHGEVSQPSMCQSWYWLPDSIKAKETIVDNSNARLDFQLTDIAKWEKEAFEASYRERPTLKINYYVYTSTCEKILHGYQSINRMTPRASKIQIDNIFNEYALYHSKLIPGYPYKKLYVDIRSSLKRYFSQHPNMTEKQKADEIYNYLCMSSKTLGIPFKSGTFWIYFSNLTTDFKLTRSYGIVNHRYAGEWRDRLFDEGYCHMMELGDGSRYYPNYYSLSCAIDQPSFYEGMEGVFFDAQKKALKYKNCKDFDKLTRRTISVTPAEKNRSEYIINATFDSTDVNALKIDRTVSIIGSEKKSSRDELGCISQYDSIMRAHFRISNSFEQEAKRRKMSQPDIKRYLAYFEQEPLLQKKAFQEEASKYFNNNVEKITYYKINNYGLFPDSPAFSYTSTAKVDELVRTTSSCKIISVGHLLKDLNFSTLKKKRTANIVQTSTFQDVYKISLEIPNGYKVENAELLTSKVSNDCGAFLSCSEVKEGKLTITVDWKINNVEFPTAQWGEILEILNAYQSFFDKSVVLTQM